MLNQSECVQMTTLQSMASVASVWNHFTDTITQPVTVFLMKGQLNYAHDSGSDGKISLGCEKPSTN